jgi:hypothetical protein
MGGVLVGEEGEEEGPEGEHVLFLLAWEAQQL